MVKVDVVKDRIINANGYGLKDHGEVPIDINWYDKKCVLKTYPNLFSLRTPDGIAAFRYNGRHYILTSKDGSNKRYGRFRDQVDANEIFLVSWSSAARSFENDISLTQSISEWNFRPLSIQRSPPVSAHELFACIPALERQNPSNLCDIPFTVYTMPVLKPGRI